MLQGPGSVSLCAARTLLACCHASPGWPRRLRVMKLRVLVVSTALAASACTGGDSRESGTTTSALTTTTTTTTATTVTTAPLSSLSWSRVAVFGGADLSSVTGGGPGLVAVGLDESGGDADAVVWTSADGITWSRVAHDEAVLGGTGDQVMWSVTGGGPGLVAVGLDESGGDADAVVWTSADGITWSRVAHDEAVLGGTGDQLMWSVTGGGPGLVAVGVDRPGGDADAVVWTSADGITWS